MKFWIAVVAAMLIGPQAHAQTDPQSVAAYIPSCVAAADIVQGKRPAADSADAAKQLRTAALCFGAVTAIVDLAQYFKPEFAFCPRADKKAAIDQAVLVVIAYLKKHPEQLRDNFHQTAAGALAAAWPCAK